MKRKKKKKFSLAAYAGATTCGPLRLLPRWSIHGDYHTTGTGLPYLCLAFPGTGVDHRPLEPEEGTAQQIPIPGPFIGQFLQAFLSNRFPSKS